MKAISIKLFGAGFMLATAMASFAAFSQESGEEDAAEQTTAREADDRESLEPGVDTSAEIEDRDALEPSVPSQVLAADVSRQADGNGVMDTIELGRSEITGNQELPKVLYIVPWKKSDPGDLVGPPVNTLLDEVLAPLDRDEFLRRVDYHDDLYGK